MFKKILVLVVQGMVAVVPIMLTVYAIYWIVVSVEMALIPILPQQYYFVGMGWVAGFLLLLGVGILVNAYAVKALLNWWGSVFERIPLIKTLYGAIQDAVNLINVGKEQKLGSVVSVEVTPSIHLLGFITNQEGETSLFKDSQKVGVYVPLSYQIGGYTLYIDKEKVSELDIDVESAMRIALTGGASKK